jgi:PilZ domain
LSASSPGSAKKPQSEGKSAVFDRRRRKTPRFYASFPVVVVTLSDNGYTHLQGQAQDLSEAGIGVLLAAELSQGEVVTLGFTVTPILFELRAVVRHRRACRYGLEFLGLSLEQKVQIAEFVKDLPSAD